MAQDIRDLFKDDKMSNETMPKNHQNRFQKKLDIALPVSSRTGISWMKVAASVVVFLGLSFGTYRFLSPSQIEPVNVDNSKKVIATKTLGDISPGLKKVEDYYLASINLELSKMSYTPETKELFDGYLEQIATLDEDYQKLSLELTESGLSELTVNALIDNLKLRLNLLYRLRSQLEQFNVSENINAEKQSI
ncbi:hypothetical protein KFZ70_11720 [Tamlana fucoidanivorans]|uniref:Uncharacterized protein n=1 Tax=Allotamlana fucoidanivorans TaxID=2583814 RepID=A0A5C4SHN5_9FLAO|nr:hypothetical protein [Tamlana fucoidanivorans]TNJ43063.1 hypothetical protein FGF67_11920 [Tamlana fucoidanivorans]